MRVLVGMEARRDRDALAVVDLRVRRDRAEDRLGVRPGQVAEPLRDPRQVPLVAHPVQQPLGAERGGREHHLLGGQRAGGRASAGLGLREPHAYVVPAALLGGARRDPRDGRERQHRRAVLLGEVEVVLHQGVLGVVPAAGHALAAAEAGVAVRAGATEVGVGDPGALLLAGAAEEHPDRRRVERLPHAHVGGDLLHHVVGRRAERVLDHAEHPLGLVVERLELGAPVGDVPPLRVVVERRERLVERVRVDQRAAADPGAGHDHAVLEGVDPLDAVAAGLGTEEVLLQVPGGGGQVRVLEAGAGLEHADPVALLGEPQRGHRAAEARADDQDVEVEVAHARPSFLSSLSCEAITFA